MTTTTIDALETLEPSDHDYQPMGCFAREADIHGLTRCSGELYVWGNATLIVAPCGAEGVYVDATIDHDCWAARP